MRVLYLNAARAEIDKCGAFKDFEIDKGYQNLKSHFHPVKR